jgi:hypothetical protein
VQIFDQSPVLLGELVWYHCPLVMTQRSRLIQFWSAAMSPPSGVPPPSFTLCACPCPHLFSSPTSPSPHLLAVPSARHCICPLLHLSAASVHRHPYVTSSLDRAEPAGDAEDGHSKLLSKCLTFLSRIAMMNFFQKITITLMN